MAAGAQVIHLKVSNTHTAYFIDSRAALNPVVGLSSLLQARLFNAEVE
jgi:hypothetical protein